MNTASKKTVSNRLTFRMPALLCAAAALALGALPNLRADGSKVHALVNFEVSDEYLTPRGMLVQNKGLTYQQLLLGFVDLYQGGSGELIDDVTFVPGVWADFTSRPIAIHVKGKGAADWVETDPIAGLSIKFAKVMKLDVTYTAFDMHILDIGTSQHLETKLSLDDSSYLGSFALNPYISYWKELDGKATAAANFNVPSSGYTDIGIDPGCKEGAWKFDAPLRMLLPEKNFYGTHFAKKSTVGLYEIGAKGTVSLDFMPKGYGFWSFHIGIKYMKFVDKNLQHLALGGGFGSPISGNTQVYAGFSTFF